jgi:hypothetical protein
MKDNKHENKKHTGLIVSRKYFEKSGTNNELQGAKQPNKMGCSHCPQYGYQPVQWDRLFEGFNSLFFSKGASQIKAYS